MNQSALNLAGAIGTPFIGLPVLAQLPFPAAAEFGAWMLSLACFVVIVRQILILVRETKEGLRERPSPAETYQTKQAASDDRRAQMTGCQVTHTALNKLLDERNANNEKAIGEIKGEIRGLSARIDSVLRLVPGRYDHG